MLVREAIRLRIVFFFSLACGIGAVLSRFPGEHEAGVEREARAA